MTFIARIFRFLFWLIVVSWGASLLRRLVRNLGQAAPQPNSDIQIPNDALSRKLVRDPVCGLHLAEGLAVPLRTGGELLHFCSMECRDKYLNGTQKLAANA